MKRIFYSPLGAAVFSLILGILGGGLAYILINNYLIPTPPVARETTKIINQPTDLLPGNEVRQRISRQLIKIYTLPTDVAGQSLWTENELLGYGLTITNNGWLMTAANPTTLSDLRLIDQYNNIYQPTEAVRDDFLDLTYLKIPMENSVPADFTIKPGEELFNTPITVTDGQTWWQSVSVTELMSRLPSNLSHENTLGPTRGHRLNQNLFNRLNGLPAINDQGKIIGLIRDNGYLLPSYYFTERFTELLSTEKIKRPTVKLDYFDLSLNPIDKFFNDSPIKQGILIIKAAPETNLLTGDIITQINGRALDKDNNFTNSLQEFNPDDTINLNVIRNDQTIELQLTLH